MMKSVEKAGIRGIKSKRKPAKIGPEDFFEDGEILRSQFSELIDNADPNRVVIIPSVSYGLANVTSNLPKKKGSIIVASEQFPSNIYPWMATEYDLKIIGPTEDEHRGESWNAQILSAIDANTAAVAIGHVHWADGTLFNLHAIRDKTKKFDAALIIDGTQSVGALPFSVTDYKPDALVCAGYKWLMGPYSIGMAYYGEMFDDGKPIENNWINRHGAQNFGGLVSYADQYMGGSLRYEVGEHSNFILLPMMVAALKQVRKWKPSEIQGYCNSLVEPVVQEIKEIGFTVEEEAYRASHLFGIRPPSSIEIEEVKSSLQRKKVNISVRGTALRISPHVYNDQRDLKRLVDALEMSKSKS